MRNNTLNVVHTRTTYNVIESGNLTLSASAYSANDYLCTNYITYSGAFLEQTDAFTRIIGVRIRENITSGTLQKPDLTIRFFDTCDITTTANDAFDFADGTNTTSANVVGSLTVLGADYSTIVSGGNSYDAVATVYFNNPPVVQGTSNREIKAIPITTGTPTFGASTEFSIDLIVEMC